VVALVDLDYNSSIGNVLQSGLIAHDVLLLLLLVLDWILNENDRTAGPQKMKVLRHVAVVVPPNLPFYVDTKVVSLETADEVDGVVGIVPVLAGRSSVGGRRTRILHRAEEEDSDRIRFGVLQARDSCGSIRIDEFLWHEFASN
jgi:hypothetical protein